MVDTCQDKSFKPAEQEKIWPLHQELYSDDTDHPGEVCYMLVCRTILGHALRTRRHKKTSAARTPKPKGGRKDQAQKDPRGRALGSDEIQDINQCLPEEHQYDYVQLYPDEVDRERPTDDGAVFQTNACRELKCLHLRGDQLCRIPYNSLIAETCPYGKLWRADKKYAPCPRASDPANGKCPSGRERIHRYREIVLFHGEQVYPEYLIAYKRTRSDV